MVVRNWVPEWGTHDHGHHLERVSSSGDTMSTSPTTAEYIYASQGTVATGIALDNITSVNVLVVVVIPTDILRCHIGYGISRS